ncbi:alpha-E domain-containing protein [Hymenobacter caeli]|uniref:Alpha-E superfamily protein n=1 Tax=Hymenobacter caeli TaxID=2735894 RepID=A0ABX2FM18_9BACT|nr:alpha-E domain-containing protein [Hymenobacter caeli]NRT18177.1 putative alpha-E superfamily protein [Hymenobacter caeli]
MLSRVAETIYWLARYMERTQTMLQVVRIHYIAKQDEQHYPGWQALLHNYGDLSDEEIEAVAPFTARVLHHLLLDKGNGASAFNAIGQGRENARAVQDHISKEVWQSLNDFYHVIRQPEVAQQILADDPVSGIDALLRQNVLYVGTVQNAMPRDEGYTFLNMGKYLERALQTVAILQLHRAALVPDAAEAAGGPQVRYLLLSLYGYEQYVKTYKGQFSPAHALHFAVHDVDFPHSLAYALGQLVRFGERLQGRTVPEHYEQVRFLLGKVKTDVEYHRFAPDDAPGLDAFLQQTRQELLAVADAFGTYYFGHS